MDTKELLGKQGKDKITGFTGIVTGVATHLYGCDTVGLSPSLDKDGKIQDSHWFDIGRIEVIGEGIKPEDVRVEKNGAGSNPTETRSHP